MNPQAKELAEKLKLLPHPEGGFFKEVYRSIGTIPQHSLPAGFNGDRNFSTAIYFLLTSENFSAFHRIQQDEVWHFYLGSPLYVHVIDLKGNYTRHQIGNHILEGEKPILVVRAGEWFASSVKEPDSYSLVGCTVAPGFDFADFELADRIALTRLFPAHKEVITQFTRENIK